MDNTIQYLDKGFLVGKDIGLERVLGHRSSN